METLYIKINISKSDKETSDIRDAGLFFSSISDAIGIDRNNIEEIDEENYYSEINNILNIYSNIKNDKG